MSTQSGWMWIWTFWPVLDLFVAQAVYVSCILYDWQRNAVWSNDHEAVVSDATLHSFNS